MFPYLKSLALYGGAMSIIAVSFIVLIQLQTADTLRNQGASIATTTNTQFIPIEKSTSTPEETAAIGDTVPVVSEEVPEITLSVSASEAVSEELYQIPALSFDVIDASARVALVNILCMTTTRGLSSISGSGVVIDESGIILTNAHVAQYVLLSQSPDVNLSCDIRTGSPAHARFKAEVLYIPPQWIEAHVMNITRERSSGTGEDDFALLRITNTIDGSPLPVSFKAIAPDSREDVTLLNDPVLAASYPAEFLSGSALQYLYPLSSITRIQDLFTFGTDTIDLVSIGSIAGAQGGSSGGAVINAWGRLVGVITTTTEGATTAERTLRAITVPYINRALIEHTGNTLASLLAGDAKTSAAQFNADKAPALIKILLEAISSRVN